MCSAAGLTSPQAVFDDISLAVQTSKGFVDRSGHGAARYSDAIPDALKVIVK